MLGKGSYTKYFCNWEFILKTFVFEKEIDKVKGNSDEQNKGKKIRASKVFKIQS